jgi:hypothetical protein
LSEIENTKPHSLILRVLSSNEKEFFSVIAQPWKWKRAASHLEMRPSSCACSLDRLPVFLSLCTQYTERDATQGHHGVSGGFWSGHSAAELQGVDLSGLTGISDRERLAGGVGGKGSNDKLTNATIGIGVVEIEIYLIES